MFWVDEFFLCLFFFFKAETAFDVRLSSVGLEMFLSFCSIVVYPVIPKGLILLRLIPTSMHTLIDVELTLKAFSAIKERLENGVYQHLSTLVKAWSLEHFK